MMGERGYSVVVLETDMFDLFQCRSVRVKQDLVLSPLAVQLQVITPPQSQIIEKPIERNAGNANGLAGLMASRDSGMQGRLALD